MSMLHLKRFFDLSASEFKEFWESLTDEEKESFKTQAMEAMEQEEKN